jgi:hypothetical protein
VLVSAVHGVDKDMRELAERSRPWLEEAKAGEAEKARSEAKGGPVWCGFPP